MPVEFNSLTHNSSHGATDSAKVTVERGEPTQSEAQSGRPTTTDTVSLTDTAKQIHKLANTLAAQPVVDPKRVEETNRAVANGSFEISVDKVADKLIQFERTLGATG